MINVFIGRDRAEDIAWHVLAHSLVRRSSEPLALTAIGNSTLPKKVWWRERGPHDSTEFSNARFAIPALMGYRGWAVFMDCDMVCDADIAELWEQRDERYAVMVVKHDYRPKTDTKFLGQEQSRYARKNWSSLMLINCGHSSCSELTPDYINVASGLDLHRFDWCWDEEVGSISGLWNVLVTEGGRLEHPEPMPEDCDIKLLHYTVGGLWHGYGNRADAWMPEFSSLLAGSNPCADLVAEYGNGLSFAGAYKVRNEAKANLGSKANGQGHAATRPN